MQTEEGLLASFKACCESNYVTQSQVVRSFMREYINKKNSLIYLLSLKNLSTLIGCVY